MTRSTGRFVRVIVALALGFGQAACSVAPSPTTSPATARPSSPAVSGSLVPDPSQPPPAGLAEWQQLPPQDGLAGGVVHSVVTVGDRFFGLGCIVNAERCDLPAIWESAEGIAWRTAGPVSLPPTATRGTISAVSLSRFGTLAVGSVGQGDRSQASIWLRDGGGWTQFSPPSAADSTVTALLATNDRVIAVGSQVFPTFGGFRAWWSADGTTWQAGPPIAGDQGGSPTNLLPLDGAFLAWGHACAICPPVPSAWWLSVDGTDWQPADPPPGLEDVWVTAMDRTDGGFAAFGEYPLADAPMQVKAWAADETAGAWRSVDPPPAPDNARVVDHLVVGGGSVAAGTGQVGPDPGQPGSLVWLRGPGETTWRAPAAIPDVAIFALIQSPTQPNRVIVFGQIFDGSLTRHVIWTGLVDWAV